LLLLVRPHVALAVERWRSQHGRRVREHEDGPFPEMVSSDGGPHTGALFESVQLGHPLLPRATIMVRNSVRLGGDTQLLVVSGSNMSGKSTLLRTVGINVVRRSPVRLSARRRGTEALTMRAAILAVAATC
jgi:hypothetical protein